MAMVTLELRSSLGSHASDAPSPPAKDVPVLPSEHEDDSVVYFHQTEPFEKSLSPRSVNQPQADIEEENVPQRIPSANLRTSLDGFGGDFLDDDQQPDNGTENNAEPQVEEGDDDEHSEGHHECSIVRLSSEQMPDVLEEAKDENASPFAPTGTLSAIVDLYEGSTTTDTPDASETFHGQGRLQFRSTNSAYAGSFVKGKMHGLGIYTWNDSQISYEGDFRENTINGHGLYRWPNGCMYEGEVKDGLRHGSGIFRCHSSPATYEGQWQHSKRSGKGILRYDFDGSSFYDGEWRDGKQEGFGTMVYPSGNRYEGQWRGGKKEGHGVMYWLDRNEIYTGQWKEGLQEGWGRHVWVPMTQPKAGALTEDAMLRRNVYEGQWKAGRREGRGTFWFANGALYEGQWRDNKKHGRGTFVFEDGTQFEGEFEEDRMVGFDKEIHGVGKWIISSQIVESIVNEAERNKLKGNALEEVAQRTLNGLTMHVSDIKALYRTYSNLGRSPTTEEEQDCCLMTVLQLSRLLYDSGIPSLELPLVRILQRLSPHLGRWNPTPHAHTHTWTSQAQPSTTSDGRATDLLDVSQPMRLILLREFAEALLRIAVWKFDDGKFCVPERLQILFTDHLVRLRPTAGSRAGTALRVRRKTLGIAVDEVPQTWSWLMQHLAKLTELYSSCASTVAGVATLRTLFRTLESKNIINSEKPSFADLIAWCSESHDDGEQSFFIDKELSLTEFIDILFYCARLHDDRGNIQSRQKMLYDWFLKT